MKIIRVRVLDTEAVAMRITCVTCGDIVPDGPSGDYAEKHAWLYPGHVVLVTREFTEVVVAGEPAPSGSVKEYDIPSTKDSTS